MIMEDDTIRTLNQEPRTVIRISTITWKGHLVIFCLCVFFVAFFNTSRQMHKMAEM